MPMRSGTGCASEEASEIGAFLRLTHLACVERSGDPCSGFYPTSEDDAEHGDAGHIESGVVMLFLQL
jgi:hypothetical protein